MSNVIERRLFIRKLYLIERCQAGADNQHPSTQHPCFYCCSLSCISVIIIGICVTIEKIIKDDELIGV